MGGEGGRRQISRQAFAVACAGLTCTLTDQSTDTDGTIEARSWDFGDGLNSTERNPVHTYAAPGGQFSVILTITDDDGSATTATKPVTAESVNTEPVADFTFSCVNFTCHFTDHSTDPDAGGITSHAGDFGDGSTSTERHPIHAYTAAGRFTVTLRVVDHDGALASVEKEVDVILGGVDRSGTYERLTRHTAAGRQSQPHDAVCVAREKPRLVLPVAVGKLALDTRDGGVWRLRDRG